MGLGPNSKVQLRATCEWRQVEENVIPNVSRLLIKINNVYNYTIVCIYIDITIKLRRGESITQKWVDAMRAALYWIEIQTSAVTAEFLSDAAAANAADEPSRREAAAGTDLLDP